MWLTTDHDISCMIIMVSISKVWRVNNKQNKKWYDFYYVYSIENMDDLSFTTNSRVRVYHTGDIEWIQGLRWVTKCEMNLRLFPFDTQVRNQWGGGGGGGGGDKDNIRQDAVSSCWTFPLFIIVDIHVLCQNVVYPLIGQIWTVIQSMMTSSNGNISGVTGHLCGEFTGPVSFDVFFGLRLNKRLNKQSWSWKFETPDVGLIMTSL